MAVCLLSKLITDPDFIALIDSEEPITESTISKLAKVDIIEKTPKLTVRGDLNGLTLLIAKDVFVGDALIHANKLCAELECESLLTSCKNALKKKKGTAQNVLTSYFKPS